MAVQTPSYWQEEEYQPLIEAKTLNGHTVLIPKLFEYHWEIYSRQKKCMEIILERVNQDGFPQETSHSRVKWGRDLIKTFLEVYQE